MRSSSRYLTSLVCLKGLTEGLLIFVVKVNSIVHLHVVILSNHLRRGSGVGWALFDLANSCLLLPGTSTVSSACKLLCEEFTPRPYQLLPFLVQQICRGCLTRHHACCFVLWPVPINSQRTWVHCALFSLLPLSFPLCCPGKGWSVPGCSRQQSNGAKTCRAKRGDLPFLRQSCIFSEISEFTSLPNWPWYPTLAAKDSQVLFMRFLSIHPVWKF